MYGMGMDIVTIERIRPWICDTLMLETIFTESERDFCLNKRHPHQYLAAAFAVKEAFMKAIGTGWSSGVAWRDIEINQQDGRLSIRLYNRAKELCGSREVFVSASCSGELALAAVIISHEG
jgi:holo-[acyl-carrier protein] synthase